MQELSSGTSGLETDPVENTAMAAKKVAEDGDVTRKIHFQCLCGKMFWAESVKRKYLQQQGKFYEIYHCDKSENLSERCEEDQHLFETPHTSGSLYNILSHFIYNNLNMFGIQSRPIPDAIGSTVSSLISRAI